MERTSTIVRSVGGQRQLACTGLLICDGTMTGSITILVP